MLSNELWEKAVSFHGHECPGLAIGFKACEAAMEKMGIGVSDDEDVVCVSENDACGVDAVQAILSCTVGKGNLLFHGTGKQAFSFFDRNSNKKLRVYLKAKNNADLDRPDWQKFLLNAPVDEIFSFSEPKFDLPSEARLFTSVVCELCGEGAPEYKMRLQDGKSVCLDCFEPYGRGWLKWGNQS